MFLVSRSNTSSGKFYAFLLALTCLIAEAAIAQPAKIKWYPVFKTARDQRTLALLDAQNDHFTLLRWQDSRRDATGKTTPAMPLLTVLTANGEPVYDGPIPDFQPGLSLFRFAVSNDSFLLVAYETPGAQGQTWCIRRLDLVKRQWVSAPETIFTSMENKAPMFASAWFSRSADRSHWCLYWIRGNVRAPQVFLSVFDAGFRHVWQRNLNLPEQAGPMGRFHVFCCNDGSVVLHTRVYSASDRAPGAVFDEPPSVYRPDGRQMYPAGEVYDELPGYSDALFLLGPENAELAAFYPKIGKKYTPSFEIAEGNAGHVYGAGLTASDKLKDVEGYFVYDIDLQKREGTLLQNAALPQSLRKAFLSEKAAAKKEPVEGLELRWLDWSPDGKPWVLLERRNDNLTPGRLETAAMVRLDSNFRMNAVRSIEKYQRIPNGDAQNFVSMAACPAAKGGWWLLWNQGNWPETKLMLTECRPSGEPGEFTLESASHSNVSLLPQTLLRQNGQWYFVGESEYHERIRIGRLE